MAISDAQKAILNGMCMSAQNVTLGTVIQNAEKNIATLTTAVEGIVKGSHEVTAAEGTAGEVDIDSGLSAIAGYVVNVLRSGVLVGSWKATVSEGVLTIATNSTDYVLTADDVINYIIF